MDPVRLVFKGLKEQTNVEQSMERLMASGQMHFVMQPRYEQYLGQFIDFFGGGLVDQLSPGKTVGQMLSASGANAWDNVLQIEVLLATGFVSLDEKQTTWG